MFRYNISRPFRAEVAQVALKQRLQLIIDLRCKLTVLLRHVTRIESVGFAFPFCQSWVIPHVVPEIVHVAPVIEILRRHPSADRKNRLALFCVTNRRGRERTLPFISFGNRFSPRDLSNDCFPSQERRTARSGAELHRRGSRRI